MEQFIETDFPKWHIQESAESGPLRVSGVASVTGVPNKNYRIYPTDTMAREVARMNENLNHSSRLGLVDHPYNGPASVSDVGLKFEKVWMEGNEVLFEAAIVPTQRGKDLEAVIRAGINIGISSRAQASVKPVTVEGVTYAMIQDDLELISFDAVVSPSVSVASIRQFESAGEHLPTHVYESIERLLEPVSSVFLNTTIGGDVNEDTMDNTHDLIKRVQAHESTPPEPVELPEVVETPVVEAVVEQPTVETPVEVVAEQVAATENEDTAEETVEVTETEQTPEPVVETVEVDNPVLVERLTVAESRATALEATIREDANLRSALNSLSNALHAQIDKGNFEAVAEIARAASTVSFLDKYFVEESYAPLKSNLPLVENVLTPIGALATRIMRDQKAVEVTKDELYGRRMLNIFLESCDTAEQVMEQFDVVKSQVVTEATGRRPLPEIRGVVVSGTNEVQLTEAQLEMRRLAYGS